MDLASEQIIILLNYLLPGFISAWIYFGLTAHPKPNQFERIIQALIFTIIIQIILNIINWAALFIGANIFSIGTWTENITLGFSVIVAIFLGLIVVKYMNNDKLYAIFRNKNITKETSYPSEWYGVFSEKQTYIVLHLEDGRRIYGWPEEWPSDPDNGHFSIAEAEWLEEPEVINSEDQNNKRNDSNNRVKLENVDNILLPAKDVKLIEFMKLQKKDKV